MKNIIFTILLSIPVVCSFAQEDKVDPAVLANFTYAIQLPSGNLAESFGQNFSAGLNAQYMTKSLNLIGIEGYYFFGTNIKTDVLENLRTAEGQIIGQDREYAFISQDQRGYYIGLQVGKILPVLQINNRSGVRITASAGFMEHKIRIDDKNATIPQLAGDYIKGYDRLTNGAAFTEFIGYQYLSDNGLVNFYVGVEFTQAFTQNRRDWDFHERRVLDEKRKDFLNGVRIGWILPLVQETNPEDIFY